MSAGLLKFNAYHTMEIRKAPQIKLFPFELSSEVNSLAHNTSTQCKVMHCGRHTVRRLIIFPRTFTPAILFWA